MFNAIGAFNTTTGPLHWELLLRSRAVDNQLYVLGVSQALDLTSSYPAYGHSMMVDPMGQIVAKFGSEADVTVVDIIPEMIENARNQIPVLKQRRPDVY